MLPARILIVDDHPLMRVGLASILRAEPDLLVCGEADTLKLAAQLVRSQRPDLVILDLSLGDGNGMDLIKRLKRQEPSIKILVCSIHDEILFAERAINAGALGYINKHQAVEKVTEAVRQTLAGKVYLSMAIRERVDVRHSSQIAGNLPAISELSDRELEVFELIGSGLSTTKIAERLHLSTKTVESHREKIKRKLHLESAAELVRYAVQWQLEQA
jgi:DNA-binding NarL/FixJ family response regulator